MGKKYIVEVGRLERLYKASVNGNGKPNITWLAPEVDLTPYTEPDLEQVRKEGYEEGKKQAKVQAELDVCHDIEKVAKGNYKAGLSDAWEAARKIIRMPEVDLLNLFTECYSAVCTPLQVFLKYDASECIEKIQAYEQEKAEIQVGDEVITASGKAVVTGVGPIHFEYDNADGSHGFDKVKNVKKTGRHFPEIASVLDRIREDGNQNRKQETMSDDY